MSILHLLSFNSFNKFIHTCYDICGEANHAVKTNVALIHHPIPALLLIVEDNVMVSKTDVEAQITAKAIATFQFNN